MLPPARWGTGSKRLRCILRCSRMAAPALHRWPQPVLRLTHIALPWRRGPHSLLQTSSCATAQSTTSKSGSTVSPSLSVPHGAPRRRPSLGLTLSQPRATRPEARLHHPIPKMAPWHQGARPRDVIRHDRCPRAKREATKKSHSHEKLHPLAGVKTVRRLRRRRADLDKTKLYLRGGHQ